MWTGKKCVENLLFERERKKVSQKYCSQLNMCLNSIQFNRHSNVIWDVNLYGGRILSCSSIGGEMVPSKWRHIVEKLWHILLCNNNGNSWTSTGHKVLFERNHFDAIVMTEFVWIAIWIVNGRTFNIIGPESTWISNYDVIASQWWEKYAWIRNYYCVKAIDKAIFSNFHR